MKVVHANKFLNSELTDLSTKKKQTKTEPEPVWCSGNTLVSINIVALDWARLLLGWVTVC